MKSYDKICIIKYRNSEALVGIKWNDKYKEYQAHWSFGVGYMPVKLDELEIIKDYDFEDTKSSTLDKIEIDYLSRQTPNPSEPCVSYGWIDLEGNFYACEYHDHIQLSKTLCASKYNELENEFFLEDKGWIKVYAVGFHFEDSYMPNDAQKKTMLELYFCFVENKDNVELNGLCRGETVTGTVASYMKGQLKCMDRSIDFE
jgi:hypothetical protein